MNRATITCIVDSASSLSLSRQTTLHSSGPRIWADRALSSSSTKTWQRSAIRVKNTEVEKDNPYLDLIRDTHDPSMHLKTIEDELKGTIGKALGKQGEKVLYFIRLMQETNEEYQLAVQKNCPHTRTKKALAFNEYRKEAVQARWELLVHRQAAGFIVNNHRTVYEHYPIPEPLPEDIENDENQATVSENKSAVQKVDKTKKSFGDQLDWWQRVGRWR